MAKVRIKLLGDSDVQLGTESHLHFRLKKAKVLLAYLALQQGEPTSREKLAHLLWSDRDNKQARASLRQALSELRNVLGQLQPTPLITNSINVAFDPSVTEVDACRFVSLSLLDDETSLQAAADLYKGAFFDGVDAGCPAFEEWLDQERRNYHERAVRTLSKLLAGNVHAEQREKAISNAEKLLRLEPLDEATYRILMRLHAAEGRYNRALQHFDHFQELLRRELDVTPEPETVALADQIRSDRLSGVAEGSENRPEKMDAPGRNSTVARGPATQGAWARHAKNILPVAGGRWAVVALGVVLAAVIAILAYTKLVSPEFSIANAPIGEAVLEARPEGGLVELAALLGGQASDNVEALAVQSVKENAVQFGKFQSSSALANDAYHEGLALFRKQTPSALLGAIESFERALVLDAGYAHAEAALANTYLYGYVMHWPSVEGLEWASDALEQAKSHAQNTLRGQNPPALAYTVLAKARFFGSEQTTRYEEAVTQARAAFVLDPSAPATYVGLGQIFIYGGEPERAIAHLKLARKLDPAQSGLADYYLALAYFHMERFTDAADHVERALRQSPDAYSVWALAAAIYGYLGRQEDAIFSINHARSLSEKQGVGPVSAELTPGYMAYARSIDRARLRHGLNVACFLIGVKLGE